MIAVTEMIITLGYFIMKDRETPKVKSKNKQKKYSDPTVIKVNRVIDYEVAVKQMTTPFDKELIPELVLYRILKRMR